MSIFKRLFGQREKAVQSVDQSSWTRIFDWTPGAWQTHTPLNSENSVLSYPTMFACITLIQNDIAKMRPTVQARSGTVWVEAPGATSILLRRPNRYQDHIQFKQHWLNSKLVHGNTYALKQRGPRGFVDELHILDPLLVQPLVADNGDVFYRINDERLAGLNDGEHENQMTVPASEIIHDRWNCLYHPLVGLSPIFAAGTAAQTGLSTQKDMRYFFANGAKPSGVLTAPGLISESTAHRIKDYWKNHFSGEKAGRIAVLGDGLKYEMMRMSNVDAQVVQLLGWNDEKICACYHVPAYKVGVGSMPTHNNIEALTQDYYSQCLQILIEQFETCLDVGLGLPETTRVQLDLDALFRMDTATQADTLAKGVGSGIMAPDEARRKLNLPPVPGGEYPYLQQQNYSLEALSQRDNAELMPQEPDDFTEALALFETLTRAAPIKVIRDEHEASG